MVYLGACLLQNFNGVQLSADDSIVNCVLSVDIDVVHFHAVLSQNLDYLVVSLLGCVVQWGLLEVVLLLEVDT